MKDLTRREFVKFIGGGAGAVAAAATLPSLIARKKTAGENGELGPDISFTPVRLPHPLPCYQDGESFLATGLNGAGDTLLAEPFPTLSTFTVVDDVVVPPEYEVYTLLKWGDRIYANDHDYCGYNHDYTTYLPLAHNPDQLGMLWVNHEYTNAPFEQAFPDVIGQPFPTDPVEEQGERLYNVGGSAVLTWREDRSSPLVVVPGNTRNVRYHGLSGMAVNAMRTDGYESMTRWGALPHQAGDDRYLVGTGPVASDVFLGINADGLGNKIIGTYANCSGATTPWGTVLTAEENFQPFGAAGVTEEVGPDGSQTEYSAGTWGETFGLLGEKYGYLTEIHPDNPDVKGKKHTVMGRFRHENAALRCERSRRLVAYLGDDRRGGHVWKFVSDGIIKNVQDPKNSQLFNRGRLYAAKFNADGSGEWLELALHTPTNPNVPSEIGSVEIAALGSAQRDGRVRLPQRNGIGGATEDGGTMIVDTSNEVMALPGYQNKTLADFYTSRGAVFCDAFPAANLMGATPCGRPEDIEVHPYTNEVIIAFTDGIAGGDGYADSRIFTVGKYDAAANDAQPCGGLFKIIEDSADGAGPTFTWDKFLKGGEAGADEGAGFANVDNLAFDREANVWCVTDMSTSRQNGFRTGPDPSQRTIDHGDTGGTSALVGVFGNNWMFYVPTQGPGAGKVIPFAHGPMRCEMTGPTFVDNNLILSVQHPGEAMPIGEDVDIDASGGTLNRDIEMLDLNGNPFIQNRTLPLGSEFPREVLLSDGSGRYAPQPCTIGIRRKDKDTFL